VLNDTRIPSQRVDLVNKLDGGGPSRPWFRFFSNLYEFVGLRDGVIPETSGGTGNVTYATGDILYASAADTLSRLPVPGVGNAAYLGTDGTNMPQWVVVAYGAFLFTTSSSFAANTPTAITFSTTEHSKNVALGSPASRVYVSNTGLYNAMFSVQLANTSTSQIDDCIIWLKLGGTDIANTATHISVPVKHSGVNGTAVLTVNVFHDFDAGEYFELYALSQNGTSQVTTIPGSASPLYPQSPAVILTVNQIV